MLMDDLGVRIEPQSALRFYPLRAISPVRKLASNFAGPAST
jgi:hypothetical protein